MGFAVVYFEKCEVGPPQSARQVFQPAFLLQAGVRPLLEPDGVVIVVAQRLKAVLAKSNHVAYELRIGDRLRPIWKGRLARTIRGLRHRGVVSRGCA